MALTEKVSAVLLRKLPPKLKDPGSFTIPCRIGDHDCELIGAKYCIFGPP